MRHPLLLFSTKPDPVFNSCSFLSHREQAISTIPHANIRIRRLLWVGITTLGLLAIVLIVTRQQLNSQGETATDIGSSSYQFIGRIDQDGLNFTGYGYLYDVQGVAPQDLFADPLNPSESTAHLTYYTTATLSSRAVVTDELHSIFALNSLGDITYYYQATPSASFENPQSFANGAAVTSAALHFQDVLSVQGPNRDLATGNGGFAILTAEPFMLGYETVRFGVPGSSYQISTWGDALRSGSLIPQSSVLLAGNAVGSGPRQAFLPYVAR